MCLLRGWKANDTSSPWQMEETLTFVRMLEQTGISAVAVHGRLRDERPRHPNHDDVIKIISENASIPVIAKLVRLLGG